MNDLKKGNLTLFYRNMSRQCKIRANNIENKVKRSLAGIWAQKVALICCKNIQSGNFRQGQITQCSPAQILKQTLDSYVGDIVLRENKVKLLPQRDAG